MHYKDKRLHNYIIITIQQNKKKNIYSKRLKIYFGQGNIFYYCYLLMILKKIFLKRPSFHQNSLQAMFLG